MSAAGAAVLAPGTREGLHVLSLAAGATYARQVTGLDTAKHYLFSVWKDPGTGWVREQRPGLAPDSSGALTVTLNQAASYDQAELVEDPGTLAVESWIPENRLGRVDWFLTDHLGSTKLLVSQDGSSRFMGDDDPFGINLRSMGDKDAHRFTGQVFDENHEFYYFGARYYAPEIGRFVSGDPAKEYYTLFSYVGNNPVRSIDKDGQQEAPHIVSGYYYYGDVSRGFMKVDPTSFKELGWFPTLPSNSPKMEHQRGYNAENDVRTLIVAAGAWTGLGLVKSGTGALVTAGYLAETVSIADVALPILTFGSVKVALTPYSRGTLTAEQLTYPKGWAIGTGEISPIKIALVKGSLIDRYRLPNGKWASPVGTSFRSRAIPASSGGSLWEYQVLRPLPATMSIVAPAQNSPGGGIQFHFEQNMETLVNEGYLSQPRFIEDIHR